MATAAQMDAHYQRTSIPRNHKLPKPRPIKTLPKLLFLSDPLRQNRYPNPDFAADGSAQQRVWTLPPDACPPKKYKKFTILRNLTNEYDFSEGTFVKHA